MRASAWGPGGAVIVGSQMDRTTRGLVADKARRALRRGLRTLQASSMAATMADVPSPSPARVTDAVMTALRGGQTVGAATTRGASTAVRTVSESPATQRVLPLD